MTHHPYRWVIANAIVQHKAEQYQTRCDQCDSLTMNTITVPILIAIFLTFLLAGFVKGVIGLGLPTVAVGLLSLVMTPVQAAVLLVVPSLVTNVWQSAAGPRFVPLFRQLRSMLLGICLGTWGGMGLLNDAAPQWAPAALGIVLMVYAGTGLAALQLAGPRRAERWLSPIVGALTGLVTAATGVFVVPAVPYLQTLGFEKEELVQALGLSFTVSTVALAAGLAAEGSYNFALAGASFLALLPALLGMVCGQWVRLRVRPQVFRRWFFVGLLALGAHLIVQSTLQR